MKSMQNYSPIATLTIIALFGLLYSACGNKKQWQTKLLEICNDKKITLTEYKEFKELFEKEKGTANEKWCLQTGKIDSIAFIEYLKSEKCKLTWEKPVEVNYHIYIDGSELTKGYIKKAGMSKTINGILYEKVAKMIEKK